MEIKHIFAILGASYEKGTNERHNGMIREYIPKGRDIDKYSVEYIEMISNNMNDLERKMFEYSTPYQMVLKEYDSVDGTERLFNLQKNVNNMQKLVKNSI